MDKTYHLSFCKLKSGVVSDETKFQSVDSTLARAAVRHCLAGSRSVTNFANLALFVRSRSVWTLQTDSVLKQFWSSEVDLSNGIFFKAIWSLEVEIIVEASFQTENCDLSRNRGWTSLICMRSSETGLFIGLFHEAVCYTHTEQASSKNRRMNENFLTTLAAALNRRTRQVKIIEELDN